MQTHPCVRTVQGVLEGHSHHCIALPSYKHSFMLQTLQDEEYQQRSACFHRWEAGFHLFRMRATTPIQNDEARRGNNFPNVKLTASPLLWPKWLLWAPGAEHGCDSQGFTSLTMWEVRMEGRRWGWEWGHRLLSLKLGILGGKPHDIPEPQFPCLWKRKIIPASLNWCKDWMRWCVQVASEQQALVHC